MLANYLKNKKRISKTSWREYKFKTNAWTVSKLPKATAATAENRWTLTTAAAAVAISIISIQKRKLKT